MFKKLQRSLASALGSETGPKLVDVGFERALANFNVLSGVVTNVRRQLEVYVTSMRGLCVSGANAVDAIALLYPPPRTHINLAAASAGSTAIASAGGSTASAASAASAAVGAPPAQLAPLHPYSSLAHASRTALQQQLNERQEQCERKLAHTALTNCSELLDKFAVLRVRVTEREQQLLALEDGESRLKELVSHQLKQAGLGRRETPKEEEKRVRQAEAVAKQRAGFAAVNQALTAELNAYFDRRLDLLAPILSDFLSAQELFVQQQMDVCSAVQRARERMVANANAGLNNNAASAATSAASSSASTSVASSSSMPSFLQQPSSSSSSLHASTLSFGSNFDFGEILHEIVTSSRSRSTSLSTNSNPGGSSSVHASAGYAMYGGPSPSLPSVPPSPTQTPMTAPAPPPAMNAGVTAVSQPSPPVPSHPSPSPAPPAPNGAASLPSSATSASAPSTLMPPARPARPVLPQGVFGALSSTSAGVGPAPSPTPPPPAAASSTQPSPHASAAAVSSTPEGSPAADSPTLSPGAFSTTDDSSPPLSACAAAAAPQLSPSPAPPLPATARPPRPSNMFAVSSFGGVMGANNSLGSMVGMGGGGLATIQEAGPHPPPVQQALPPASHAAAAGLPPLLEPERLPADLLSFAQLHARATQQMLAVGAPVAAEGCVVLLSQADLPSPEGSASATPPGGAAVPEPASAILSAPTPASSMLVSLEGASPSPGYEDFAVQHAGEGEDSTGGAGPAL